MLSPTNISSSYIPLLSSLSPRRTQGSADTRWPAATAADPEKKQTCHTAFINVAGSRGASRPFPRKTLSHNFHHRGCIPRGFSYVLVSVPQGPDDGSSQESFVLHRDQGTKQGTKQDSAPSWTQPPHFTLCLALSLIHI